MERLKYGPPFTVVRTIERKEYIQPEKAIEKRNVSFGPAGSMSRRNWANRSVARGNVSFI